MAESESPLLGDSFDSYHADTALSVEASITPDDSRSGSSSSVDSSVDKKLSVSKGGASNDMDNSVSDKVSPGELVVAWRTHFHTLFLFSVLSLLC
jgi:hypothetical protein